MDKPGIMDSTPTASISTPLKTARVANSKTSVVSKKIDWPAKEASGGHALNSRLTRAVVKRFVNKIKQNPNIKREKVEAEEDDTERKITPMGTSQHNEARELLHQAVPAHRNCVEARRKFGAKTSDGG